MNNCFSTRKTDIKLCFRHLEGKDECDCGMNVVICQYYFVKPLTHSSEGPVSVSNMGQNLIYLISFSKDFKLRIY